MGWPDLYKYLRGLQGDAAGYRLGITDDDALADMANLEDKSLLEKAAFKLINFYDMQATEDQSGANVIVMIRT